MPTIALITPHIEGREELWQQMQASVANQTRPPDEWFVELDTERLGCAVMQNRALAKVTSDFVALMADDDLMLPEHLATLEAYSADADVVYPDCIQLGASHAGIAREYDRSQLQFGNYIPGGGSLIRAELARQVGGWCIPGDPDWSKYEDWVMWKRLGAINARFRRIPQQTWVYRFHAGQTEGQR